MKYNYISLHALVITHLIIAWVFNCNQLVFMGEIKFKTINSNFDTIVNTRNSKISATKSLNNSINTVPKFKEITIISEYNDYPKYIDTGNPQKDDATFKQKKIQWIKQNPEKYEKLNAPKNQSESQIEELKMKLQQIKKND